MADDKAPKRPAPAYQEYASDMLANERVREISLAELGLLVAMRWACWHNGDIPRELVAEILRVTWAQLELPEAAEICLKSV